MNFETIETDRLILTGLSPEDMSHIFTTFSKPEIKRILGHRSDADYEMEAYKQQNGYASYNRRFKLFLLTDKVSGNVIGRCGIHNWNKDHRRAETGYAMQDENFRRKGLMGEAFAAVLNYGFDTLHLNRIEALVGFSNTASLRLMEKNDFTREAVLRQHCYAEGKYEDSVLFSKLYEEHAGNRI